MSEIVEYIENEGALLTGIYHKAQFPDAHEKPAILMWNVGVSSRIGPQRQYVDLARQLANLNFEVFRFDLGGLGDSIASDKSTSRLNQEVSEIQSAMDHICSTYKHKKFVLIGFCSSASNAHPTMVKDQRVAGAILIDGYGYKTLRFHFYHIARRALSPRHWMSRIKRITAMIAQSSEANLGFFFDFPAQRVIEDEVVAVAERGVRLFYIYTGGIQSYYNYAEQFWDMFPRLRKFQTSITVSYHQDANHLFMYRTNRDTFFSEIKNWIVKEFNNRATKDTVRL